LLFVVPLLGISTSAATDQELAELYSPILYFEGQETCFPVDVFYHIDNSYLYRVGSDEPLSTSPSETELASYSTDEYQYVYLDNQKGTVSDEGVIADYQNNMNSYETTVYYRVFSDGTTKVVQYWMFYAFNKGELNQHEGDWEMVQAVLLGESPTGVMYSQHQSGQQATWGQVEKENHNIKVYVARGSHANYLRSYSGKFGISSDIVGNNGRVLESTNYELVELDSQGWLNFSGRWGEFGTDEASAAEAMFRGQAGPFGPMYRGEGTMWNNPVSWGNSLQAADDNIFLLDWFLYNFVTIFLLLTALSLCLIGFRIYRRHKKYGIGPRILSMLYIDGFNLKSIGNILCFVGIIIAIMGLIYPWYTVSADVNVGGYGTSGMVDVISIDGMNGVQITIPGITGSIPMGNVLLPFSLLIGISLIFMFLACIGINRSVKLGFKYIGRGIRVMMPIIILIITIALLGSVISSAVSEMEGGSYATDMFNSISGSPFGGQKTIPVNEESITGNLGVQWGVGLGGLLLLLSGIILIISGIFEVVSNKIFFEPKTPVGKPPKQLPVKQKKSKAEQPAALAQEDTPKSKFCPECGVVVGENEKFCGKCGSKI